MNILDIVKACNVVDHYQIDQQHIAGEYNFVSDLHNDLVESFLQKAKTFCYSPIVHVVSPSVLTVLICSKHAGYDNDSLGNVLCLVNPYESKDVIKTLTMDDNGELYVIETEITSVSFI